MISALSDADLGMAVDQLRIVCGDGTIRQQRHRQAGADRRTVYGRDGMDVIACAYGDQ
jgi:hypothetical protein